MKKIIVLLLLAVAMTKANAQRLTAAGMIEETKCRTFGSYQKSALARLDLGS